MGRLVWSVFFRVLALPFGLMLLGLGGASSQVTNFTTNVWVINGNGYWAFTNNWFPSNSYPNSVGALALVTNNTGSDQAIYLTNDIALGQFYFGDFDTGSRRELRSTNATVNTITFDTGDGGMALFQRGSSDGTLRRDLGRFDDYTDAGVRVTDTEGLFIDSYQNFAFYGPGTAWSADPARAFNGGGNNVTKGEDGQVYFRRVVTNIQTLAIRDGYMEFQVEGNHLLKPGISNLVLGVAPNDIDEGGNPLGVGTNLYEGSAYDRVQMPYFSIIGANTTNGVGVNPAMTNEFDVTFNQGVFRSLNRPVTNGAPTVFSGDFEINGNANKSIFVIENQSFGGTLAISSIVRQAIFSGQFSGTGGFTKIGTGEMTLTGSNSFSGPLNINRAFDSGRGRYGGVGLRENGTLSGVSQITLNRDGQLYVDNSAVNISNRINDGAAILTRGRSQVEFLGNGAQDSYEKIGSVTSSVGSLAFEFDKVDGSPRSQTLEMDRLVRSPGSVVTFQASDLQQGSLRLNGPTGIVVNLLDGGASLTQVGSGGGVGASNRSVVVGVFGGDGIDRGPTTPANDVLTYAPNIGDEFMTMEGNRLRTLDPATEMVSLGGRSTNALLITQALAATDANVNIDFKARPLNLGVYSLTNQINPVADKRVVGDATFNSIRFGIVRGDPIGTVNPDDNGRALLIEDGITLASESGMLLVGRDTGSTNGGNESAQGSILVYGGSLDLDGTANNREAIIHNASSNSFFVRSSIQASQGLTKSGTDAVFLDDANNLGGAVNIAQGTLIVRDGQALRGASAVRVEGDGLLEMQWGGSFTNVNLIAGERPFGSAVLQSQSDHNVFGGDIGLDMTDPQGINMHDARVRVAINAQAASLTLLGDIGMTDSGSISPDIYIHDAQNFGFLESGGILNLKGTFGDRLVNGEALPFDPTLGGNVNLSRVTAGVFTNRAANENFVLRFNMDHNAGANSGDEAVLNIYNSWNSAGRFYAQQGTVRYLGDGGFWTTNALAVSDFANGNSGFQLGGGGTDAGASITFLLTKDGQAFNAERWTAATDNSANNTLTLGLEHFGPSNATVTIGNEFYDIDLSAADDQITISGSGTTTRELRLFAHDGYDSATSNATTGRVNVLQNIRGTDFSMLTVVGNGVIALQASTNLNADNSNDIRNFNLLGGELILDRSTNGAWAGDLRRSTDGRAALFLSGGDLTHLGRNTTTSEQLTSNLTVRAGDSRVSTVAGGGGTTELSVGTGANSVVNRQRGGTLGFVEDSVAGGTANIRLAGTGITVGQRVGSWATYGTNYGGGAFTWASTDTSSNVVAFAEGGYSVNSFGAANHVHMDGAPPVLVTNESAASLRYTNATALDLGGWTLNVVEGGILATPTVGGAASIDNGQLTSSGGEMIIHNYAGSGGSLSISAAITGNVALTHSGSGTTVLSGNNTFNGATYLNGGTLRIDSASRLGNTVSNLEMRGGTLFTTANMAITNRSIILGGDGGIFQVAAGTTNFIANVLSESNFLGSMRLNNGHGDLIKTGAGTLNLGTTASATNNLTAGFNMYQGLTDVREGTLRVVANNNYALGSNKSFYDGTIVRGGATLALGSNSFGFAMNYGLQEWIVFEQGSTLRVEQLSGTYQSPSLNGVMDFRGDTTVFVQRDDSYFNSSGAGYIMGSGDIIKDGDGALNVDAYSPDFTGDIIVKDGTVRLHGVHDNPLPNLGSITLGLNDTTDRGGVVFYAWVSRDGMASEWDINQDITVQGTSSDTRLGVHRFNHNDVVNYNGDIDLSNFTTNGSGLEFRLAVEDELSERTIGGADAGREDVYMNLNGDITGGNKRIRTYVGQSYYVGGVAPQTHDRGNQITNEVNMMVFYTLTGSNTGWTGSLEVGNRPGAVSGNGLDWNGPDEDKQHYVRFGRNDGAATLAIGASNSVVLRHNARLQAYGSQVTIGNLFSDGDSGGGDGYFGSQLVTNGFVENGGTVAGTLTIVHSVSNATFNAVMRDGTYYSPTSSNLASAALNFVKDGAGVFNTMASNYYTGTTAVRDGSLLINGAHVGGGTYTIEAGGTLGGTGLIAAAVQVLDGGILAPGNSPGTLTVDGSLSLSNLSILAFELNGADATVGGGINDLVQGVGGLTLDGVLTITPTFSFSGADTNDFWTLITYDGLLVDNGLDIDSGAQALLDPGYIFYVYNFEGGLVDEIRLGIMVPEPSTWALLTLGLGLVGWMARHRRRG